MGLVDSRKNIEYGLSFLALSLLAFRASILGIEACWSATLNVGRCGKLIEKLQSEGNSLLKAKDLN